MTCRVSQSHPDDPIGEHGAGEHGAAAGRQERCPVKRTAAAPRWGATGGGSRVSVGCSDAGIVGLPTEQRRVEPSPVGTGVL